MLLETSGEITPERMKGWNQSKYRSKKLDLIDRVPEELWMEVHNTVQEVVIKTILKTK